MANLLQRFVVSNPVLRTPYQGLPYKRNENFHFRREVLEKLNNSLKPQNVAGQLQSASLFGMGGIGKSQVALEFAYTHAKSYDAIFWINAEDESKLRASVCLYARLMISDHAAGTQDDAALVEIFYRWLATRSTTG